jgi:hypothetical protein
MSNTNTVTQVAIVEKIKGNCMGTTSIIMKLKGMRQADDFIVYPIAKDDTDKTILIQSGKRFGKLNLTNGKGTVTPSISNGANSIDYMMAEMKGKLQTFEFSPADLTQLKNHIFGTASDMAGNNGLVYSDNSGAINVL